MIGFDAQTVATLLELTPNIVPVMLVTICKALHGEQPPRLYRRPLSEIVQLESLGGNSLAELGALTKRDARHRQVIVDCRCLPTVHAPRTVNPLISQIASRHFTCAIVFNSAGLHAHLLDR